MLKLLSNGITYGSVNTIQTALRVYFQHLRKIRDIILKNRFEVEYENYRKIWSMESENVLEKSDEERIILAKIIKTEEQLIRILSEENRSILEEYNNLQIELCSLYEKESFTKGIRFATQYVFETLM